MFTESPSSFPLLVLPVSSPEQYNPEQSSTPSIPSSAPSLPAPPSSTSIHVASKPADRRSSLRPSASLMRFISRSLPTSLMCRSAGPLVSFYLFFFLFTFKWDPVKRLRAHAAGASFSHNQAQDAGQNSAELRRLIE